MSRTVGTTTLTAAQLNQLQLATSKGGAVLHSALQNVLRGSGNLTRLSRPQMVTANPTGAVIRPQQLQQGQQLTLSQLVEASCKHTQRTFCSRHLHPIHCLADH